MQQFLIFASFIAFVLIDSSASMNSTNSSILLKRCLRSESFLHKSSLKETRSPSFFLNILKHKFKYQKVQKIPTTTVTSNGCVCVPYYLCESSNAIIINGPGIIDLRFRRCVSAVEVCCYAPTIVTSMTPSPPTIPPTTTTTTTTTTTPAPTTMTTTQAPVVIKCVCVPTIQCITSGQAVIDPRQQIGTCPSTGQVCCTSSVNYPVVPAVPSCLCMPLVLCGGGYNVIDPRLQPANICGTSTVMCCKQGVNPSIATNSVSPSANLVRNQGTSKACMCMKTWLCQAGNVVTLDNAGAIDPRFGYCSSTDEVCCSLQSISIPTISTSAIVQTPYIINETPAPQTSCGIRGTAPPNVNPNNATTYFAEFPWMVALLLRNPGTNDVLLCGGSMINTKAVLTAAHCVFNRQPGILVARFGEWDTNNANEPVPFQEANVQNVVTHPQYNSDALYNDIALLILSKAVNVTTNVLPVCLPQQGTIFTAGTKCFASGWGRNAFGNNGKYQNIMRKVELPIVDRNTCQTQLRNTRLGPFFQLHGTFICAGGEASKDTCQGDGGGPLVCPTNTGRYVQAGIVSWGIGCGSSSVPAVYTGVSQYRQWIDQNLANYGIF